ncbi:nucleotidyltransferase family protein [Aureimonas psammosilenae]|uniref:nucleotidyltransferase family protein n=1 Tax=Aureimonas psammosilenae TaxID=2495496 RepID=UPI001F349598|nr:nucleotidyltransferase domain-containing protein [Aureimonas psammosilenae]
MSKNREEVLGILARFDVARPMVFGSVARGDDREGSDLDIVLELSDGATYYDVFRIEDELSDVLGVRVDVHTYGRPSSEFLSRISEDLKSI